MNAKTKTKDQTVADAIANLDANGSTLAPETTKPKRPKVIPSGKGAHGKVMFNNVPEGFKCAAQLATAIDVYFELLGDDDYHPIEIETMREYVESNPHLAKIYETQGFVTVLKHYTGEITGRDAWKYKQGKIAIGEFS